MTTNSVNELILDGITTGELSDLESTVGADYIQSHRIEKSSGTYGALDPISATVIISAMTFTAITTWLAKRRKRIDGHVKITITRKDGTVETKEISLKSYEEQSEEGVVKAIADQIRSILGML